MSANRLAVILLGCLMVTACAPVSTYDGETEDFGEPSTNVLQQGQYEGATPTRVQGATTITTRALHDMIGEIPPPVLIDVLDGQQTQSLPGAIWLPRAGRGIDLADDTHARLKSSLDVLAGGEKGCKLVFFCLSRTCWLSHNATVRAVALGYSSVFWYRGGRQAWLTAGLPLAPAHPGRW
jgi:PQQ-dependent catabolism-associated CXXCW motif protein